MQKVMVLANADHPSIGVSMSTLAEKYLAYMHELGGIDEVRGGNWQSKSGPSKMRQKAKNLKDRNRERLRSKYRRENRPPRSEPIKYGGELPPAGGGTTTTRSAYQARSTTANRLRRGVEKADRARREKESELGRIRQDRINTQQQDVEHGWQNRSSLGSTPLPDNERHWGQEYEPAERRHDRAQAHRAATQRDADLGARARAANAGGTGVHDTDQTQYGSRYTGPQYDYSDTASSQRAREFAGKAGAAAASAPGAVADKYRQSGYAYRRGLQRQMKGALSPRTWLLFKKKLPRHVVREMESIIKDSTKHLDAILKDSKASREDKEAARIQKEEIEAGIRKEFADEEESLLHWRRRQIEDMKSHQRAVSRGYSQGKTRARKMGRQAGRREITGVIARAYGSYKRVKDAVKKDALAQRDYEQKEVDQRKRGLERSIDRNRDEYLRDIRTRAAKGEFQGAYESLESLRSLEDILNEYRDYGAIHGKRGVTRRTREAHDAKASRRRTKRVKEGEIFQPHGGKREKTPPRRPRRKDKEYNQDIAIPTRSTKYDRYNQEDATDYDDTYYGRDDKYKPEPKRPEKEYKATEVERQRGKKLRRSREKPTREYTHDRYEPYKPKKRRYKHYEAIGQRPRPAKTMIQRNVTHQQNRPKPKPMMKPMTPKPMQEKGGYGDHYEKEKTSLGQKAKKAAKAVARATGADELKRVPANVHQNVKHQFVHKFLLR